jgi:hypothetical protein
MKFASILDTQNSKRAYRVEHLLTTVTGYVRTLIIEINSNASRRHATSEGTSFTSLVIVILNTLDKKSFKGSVIFVTVSGRGIPAYGDICIYMNTE